MRLLPIRIGLLIAGLLVRIRLLIRTVLRVLLAPGRLLSWPHGR
jgi:hypothetical protein